MSHMDVIKEVVEYEQLLRETTSAHVLKGEYLIRDSHPDVQKILSVDSVARVTNKEILADKIVVEGQLEYNIIYLTKSDDETSRAESVIVSEKFANYLELNGGEHSLLCEVECGIEHIDATIINERKVAVEGILNLNWEVYKKEEFEYVKEIQGSEDIQLLRKDEEINQVKGNKMLELIGKSTMKVTMDKPEIDKILKCNLSLNKKEIKLGEDKVYLGAYCNIEVLYVGKNVNEVYKLEDNVYLSKEEEIVGINADMINTLNLQVSNNQCSVNVDDLGEERIVNIEFIVKGNVKVYSKEKINMIKDAYSINSNLELKKIENEVGTVEGTNSAESIIKENLSFDGDFNVMQVLSSSGMVCITDKVVENGRVKVTGVANVSILFRKDDDSEFIGVCKGEIPYNATIDVKDAKEGMESIVKAHIENIDAVIEGNTIGVRISIVLSAKVCDKAKKLWIVDLEQNKDEVIEKKSSATIYMLGKDDSLWNLAKKYKCTIEQLLRINELENEEVINPGERIIIPGRAIL